MTVAAPKNPAQLAAFRDGPGADWKAMDKGGDGSFTAKVTGPYEVAIVCSINTGTKWVTWEHADVPNPKDPGTTNVTPPCNDDAATHTVTGTLAAAGTISLGTGAEQDVAAGGTFTFEVPDGTYDVVVHTATTVSLGTAPIKVAGANVNTNQVALGAPATLQTQAFKAKIDVDDKEMGSVQVLLATPNSPQASVIFSAAGTVDGDGNPVPSIDAKVLAAADVPDKYTQQVTYAATIADPIDDTQQLERATNRDFSVGDTGTILLPSGYGSVVWYPDPAGLSFIGDSDPPDVVSSTIVGKTTENKDAVNMVEMAQEYLSETSLARVIVETDITGYLPTWKVDIVNQPYTRDTQGVLRVDDDETDPPTHDNREWHSTQSQPGA